MKKILSLFLLCWFGLGWMEPTEVVRTFEGAKIFPENGKPEFYTMQWVNGTVLMTKKIPLQIEVKDMGHQDIELLLNNDETPVLYAANIVTPVCADGECRLMYLRFYWNLLGEYAGYDRVLEEPLTKHDHDAFLEEDYRKLHLLLQDPHSVLRGREIEDLVEKPEPIEVNGVDAVAGATITEVKESVVEGALYSCYMAWHLVHGDIKEKLKQYTISRYDQSLGEQMLKSDEYDYQLFALRRLTQDQFLDYQDRILELLKSSIPLVRTYIIKSLPQNYWKDEQLQLRTWECFAAVDINSKSLLLNHINSASERVLKLLSRNLETMTKNQLRVYLQSLNKRKNIEQETIENLQTFSTSNQATYGYVVAEFLENYEK
ncbi:MAG: hypothetical protein AB3N18_00670 [Allomuricauda sp.]